MLYINNGKVCFQEDDQLVPDTNWQIIDGPFEQQPELPPLDIPNWFKQPDLARDASGRWYLVQHIPSQEW